MKVHAAYLQSAICIPVSELNGIESLHPGKVKGLELDLMEFGLVVKTPQLSSKGHCIIIPHANIRATTVDIFEKRGPGRPPKEA